VVVGIISDFIGEKVDDLKKGKSRVIESRHTLMLGWSDMSLAIIQQIALANESEVLCVRVFACVCVCVCV
jgi:hypothetical protein